MGSEFLHDGNHYGIVRILVGLSCELGGYITFHDNSVFYYQECNKTDKQTIRHKMVT